MTLGEGWGRVGGQQGVRNLEERGTESAKEMRSPRWWEAGEIRETYTTLWNMLQSKKA